MGCGGLRGTVAVVASQTPSRPGLIPTHSQVTINEEGLRLLEHLGHHFLDVQLWWIGPFYPVLRLVHPKFVAPVLQASGISPRSPQLQPLPYPASNPSHSWTDQVEQGNGRC